MEEAGRRTSPPAREASGRAVQACHDAIYSEGCEVATYFRTTQLRPWNSCRSARAPVGNRRGIRLIRSRRNKRAARLLGHALERGYCMIRSVRDRSAAQRLDPIFATLAPGSRREFQKHRPQIATCLSKTPSDVVAPRPRRFAQRFGPGVRILHRAHLPYQGANVGVGVAARRRRCGSRLESSSAVTVSVVPVWRWRRPVLFCR